MKTDFTTIEIFPLIGGSEAGFKFARYIKTLATVASTQTPTVE